MNRSTTPICAALLATMLAAAAPAHAQEGKPMHTTAPDTALAQRLIDLHFAIWNDPEPRNWPARFPQVYASGFYVADASGKATGYEAVGRLIRKVQGEHPGFRFTPAPVAWNHGIGRVTWYYGPPTNPKLVHGEDIFTIQDGKLTGAHVFLDQPQPQ